MTDKMLRDAVIAQLDFEPEVNPAGIGVATEDGVERFPDSRGRLHAEGRGRKGGEAAFRHQRPRQ